MHTPVDWCIFMQGCGGGWVWEDADAEEDVDGSVCPRERESGGGGVVEGHGSAVVRMLVGITDLCEGLWGEGGDWEGGGGRRDEHRHGVD